MKEHGSLHCEIQGNVLVMSPAGGFNLEGMRSCDELIREAAIPLLSGPWARIEDLRRVELGEPAAIALLVENIRWGVASGCRAIAFIRTMMLHEDLAREQLRGLNCDVGYFDDAASAWAWLEARGFQGR